MKNATCASCGNLLASLVSVSLFLLLSLPASAQLDQGSVPMIAPVGDSLAIDHAVHKRYAPLFATNESAKKSVLNGRLYEVVVRDGVVSFYSEGVQVPSLPADVYAHLGSKYYKDIAPPNPSSASAMIDTEAGTFKLFGSTSGSFVDLFLAAVSILFALAFLTTGFFLLRVARQRRVVGESRMRQLQAREAERSHLAAELHDGPVQELQHVMRSYFGALSETASRSAGQILDIQSKLENVTAALRNICSDLRPPVLAHFGLAYAVRSYADKFEQRVPNINVHVAVSEEDELEDEQVSLAFFRIFQESLTNIEKHANAKNVNVSLQIDPRWVEMVVEDDGVGFEPPRRLEDLEADGHLGLSGLAQRADAVGGVFEVRSVSGEGTTIRVVARKLSRDERGIVRANLEAA